MKNVDLNPLIVNDQAYSKLAMAIKERYKCNWDDPVHDSYRTFVKETDDRSEKLQELRIKAETLKARMEEHDVAGLVDETEKLWIEAQSI